MVQVATTGIQAGGPWDTETVIRIVQAHTKYTLTQRQLQKWDRGRVVVAEQRGPNRQRLYAFQSVRQLCIIATLLKAKLPAQRIPVAIRNIDLAATKIRKRWDLLRLLTDGESVYVVDGDKGVEAISGQLVSLILLGDLEREAKAVCDREKNKRTPRAAESGRLGSR